MSKRKNRKPIGIPDTWALCGLYALLLALFFIPGIIIEGQPLSAWTLMRATDLRQFGQFPGSIAAAREMAAMPVLCAIGLVLTLAFRTSAANTHSARAFPRCCSAPSAYSACAISLMPADSSSACPCSSPLRCSLSA